MTDELSKRYGELLAGAYDCVDRIVLNAYFSLGHNPGGFRVWWRRLHNGSDQQLDNAHLMRMAGRFSRRVRAFAKAHNIPVIDCGRGERKHRIAEEYLASHTVGVGVFLILVARAAATVWEVKRSASGVIGNLEKKTAFVNHDSFHIMDPDWGHLTIKMSGHPPFAAQVIANGHEWVACQAQAAGIGFTKEGNCFTAVADPQALAQVADTLSQPATAGRLRQVRQRWIYSACLCFGLSVAEQQRSGFGYDYSVYQVEYSRNLLFGSGAQMDRVVNTVIDRTRSRLGVPMLRTLFGAKKRPGSSADLSPRLAVVIETPRWDLTLFKVHFGRLTLKGYTKGEHVLRVEATVHNTRQLGCGRAIQRFPRIGHPACGHDRAVLHHPGLRRHRRPARRHPRPAAATRPHPAAPASAASTSTSHGSGPRWRRSWPWPPHSMASPSPTLPPRCRQSAPRPAPPSARPPTTCASSAARTWLSNTVGHGATRSRHRPPHHRRTAHPPRPGHRPHRGRCPQPPTGPQAHPLYRHRPRLRDLAHLHADPLPRPRHHQ